MEPVVEHEKETELKHIEEEFVADEDDNIIQQEDEVHEQDQAVGVVGNKDDEPGLIPRRSGRISKPPKRFEDYLMQQQTVSSLATGLEAKIAPKRKAPIPAPRHSMHLPILRQSMPVPTPRHNGKIVDPSSERRYLLNTVLELQEKQCEVQDTILSLLKEN